MSEVDAEEKLEVDCRRLWAGGAASACVAALIAVVGILVARGLLRVPVLAPRSQGAWGNANTLVYIAGSAVAALAATALLHQLLVTTPRAKAFFVSIMILLTVVSVIMPLTIETGLDGRVATAVINLLIGLTVTFSLSRIATDAPTDPVPLPDERWHDAENH